MSLIRMGDWRFLCHGVRFQSQYFSNLEELTIDIHLMGESTWRILEDDLRRRKILGDPRQGCLKASWPRPETGFAEVDFVAHCDGRLAQPLWELLGGSRSRERWELAGDLAEQHGHKALAALFRRWADIGTWDS
jgi:hypothetical protein